MPTLLFHLPADILRQILDYQGLDSASHELCMTLCKRMQSSLAYAVTSLRFSIKEDSFPQRACLTSLPLRELTIATSDWLTSKRFNTIAARGLYYLPSTLVKLVLRWQNSADCLDIFAAANPYRPDDTLDSRVFHTALGAALRVDLVQACPRLEKLSFQLGDLVRNFEASKFPPSLKTLETSVPYGQTWGAPILGTVPRWLSKLQIDCHVQNSTTFMSNLPPHLTTLSIRHMEQAINAELAAILPRTLTKLTSKFALSAELGPSLPPHIALLNLDVDYGMDAASAISTLPQSLKTVAFFNTDCIFVGEHLRALPHGITHLNATIDLRYTEKSDFPPSLTLLQLEYHDDLTRADITNKVPSTLRDLVVGYSYDYLESGDLPDDIDDWGFCKD